MEVTTKKLIGWFDIVIYWFQRLRKTIAMPGDRAKAKKDTSGLELHPTKPWPWTLIWSTGSKNALQILNCILLISKAKFVPRLGIKPLLGRHAINFSNQPSKVGFQQVKVMYSEALMQLVAKFIIPNIFYICTYYFIGCDYIFVLNVVTHR